jgi:hypothetical protein
MKSYQLIASKGIVISIHASCSDNNNNGSDLNNHPAADTVSIPDPVKNGALPVPDSILKSTDTVAKR